MFSISKLIVIICIYNGLAAVDYLQCTNNVCSKIYYDTYPVTQTGRNPHRWIAEYRRVDNIHYTDKDYQRLGVRFHKCCCLIVLIGRL
ncbi:hypothetical protein NQ318_005477 [Aromia moschata]|uniref:Uncharacterized protein n=1 Tax=Aromia moschata TaxID=1265417 RepID=A0AAV8X6X4_9CUCU|nr:hypothetical protein NQ318_005477 [Aromia moschata]